MADRLAPTQRRRALRLGPVNATIWVGAISPYAAIFGLALLLRLLAVPLAMAIHEPGAWKGRDICTRSGIAASASAEGCASV